MVKSPEPRMHLNIYPLCGVIVHGPEAHAATIRYTKQPGSQTLDCPVYGPTGDVEAVLTFLRLAGCCRSSC